MDISVGEVKPTFPKYQLAVIHHKANGPLASSDYFETPHALIAGLRCRLIHETVFSLSQMTQADQRTSPLAGRILTEMSGSDDLLGRATVGLFERDSTMTQDVHLDGPFTVSKTTVGLDGNVELLVIIAGETEAVSRYAFIYEDVS